MDLLNPTAEPIRAQFDGKLYVFPPGELVSLPEEAGTFLANKYEPLGLRSVRYGDQPLLVRLSALKSKVAFYKRQIAVHERNNRVQEEKKFPLLEKPPAVAEAEENLPKYLNAVRDVERELQMAPEVEEDQKGVDHFRALGDLPMPSLIDLPMAEVRKEAARLGITPAPRTTRKQLIEAIETKRATITGKPARVKASA